MTRLGYILMLLGITTLYFASGDSSLSLRSIAIIGTAGLIMLAVGAKLAGVYYRREDER